MKFLCPLSEFYLIFYLIFRRYFLLKNRKKGGFYVQGDVARGW